MKPFLLQRLKLLSVDFGEAPVAFSVLCAATSTCLQIKVSIASWKEHRIKVLRNVDLMFLLRTFASVVIVSIHFYSFCNKLFAATKTAFCVVF